MKEFLSEVRSRGPSMATIEPFGNILAIAVQSDGSISGSAQGPCIHMDSSG